MEAMKSREVFKAARECAAHALLFTFTLFLVLKLHHTLSSSWWIVFCPLWLFHLVVVHGGFSVPGRRLDGDPGPTLFNAFVGAPLLIAFELLLCIHLESSNAVNLQTVFLPIYIWEAIIFLDSLRFTIPMSLSPPETPKESFTVEEDKQRVADFIHIFTSFEMGFNLLATYVLFQYSLIESGPDHQLLYWESYSLFGAGQLLAYGVFFIHIGEEKDPKKWGRLCIGGHVMMILVSLFLVLLGMHLKGPPARARDIPIPYIFLPLFFLQGLGVVFTTSLLVERVLLVSKISKDGIWGYLKLSSTTHDYLECMHHGLGFIGWWSYDEASKESRAQQIHHKVDEEESSTRDEEESSTRDEGCNAFCGNPLELLKKMSKEELVVEVLNLQATIDKQTKVTESTLQGYKVLQHDLLCEEV